MHASHAQIHRPLQSFSLRPSFSGRQGRPPEVHSSLGHGPEFRSLFCCSWVNCRSSFPVTHFCLRFWRRHGVLAVSLGLDEHLRPQLALRTPSPSHLQAAVVSVLPFARSKLILFAFCSDHQAFFILSVDCFSKLESVLLL